MDYNFLSNFSFWSALSGLIGSVLIFYFGLPPKIDQDGHSYLLLESTDETEKSKAKIYKKISYFGAFLLVLSFMLQLIAIV